MHQGKTRSTHHLSRHIRHERRLHLLVDARERVHGEREERLQVALDRIWEVPELFRAPRDSGHVSIERNEVRRLDDLQHNATPEASKYLPSVSYIRSARSMGTR